MKANVQYNDFVGTAAADISDHTDLKEFLASRNVNTKRYDPIGVSFYHGYSDFFTMSIVCIDNELSKDKRDHIVQISFESEISHKEFFDLFKRFNVIVTRRYEDYHNKEVNDEIIIDDRDID